MFQVLHLPGASMAALASHITPHGTLLEKWLFLAAWLPRISFESLWLHNSCILHVRRLSIMATLWSAASPSYTCAYLLLIRSWLCIHASGTQDSSQAVLVDHGVNQKSLKQTSACSPLNLWWQGWCPAYFWVVLKVFSSCLPRYKVLRFFIKFFLKS